MTTKVFIGNLAFKTTDQELEEYFRAHGEIVSAVIITRGRRSLGYGFVEFANQEEAQAAVQALDQSTFGDRQVKVEIAKAPSERVPYQSSGNGNEVGQNNETGEPVPRRRRNRNRRRRNRPALVVAGESVPPLEPTQTSPQGEGRPKKKRQPRERVAREVREKVLSTTSLFVANLPFLLDDEGLLEIFSGHGAVSARVVRTRNGRSRGYGFVEFNNEDDQKAALEKMQGFEVFIGKVDFPSRALAISISSSAPAPVVDESTQPQ